MRTHRRDSGFSLAAVIFFATAASVFIAAAVPAYQMQAKREVEAELIFRGEEYARAIRRYRDRFGAYPTTVDQLVSTNGLRFLRKPYKDPVTGKDFRLLTWNPDGRINGSKVTQPVNAQQSLFGNTQTFPQGGNNTSSLNTTNPGATSPSRGGTGTGGLTGAQPGTQAGTQPGTPRGGGLNSGTSGTFTVGTASGQAIGNSFVGGGGIAGVASDSDKDSVKVYNNRQKYNE